MEFTSKEYKKCILSEHIEIDSYDFYYQSYQEKLKLALKKFLEIESPIEYELFVRKVRLSHGFEKAGIPIRKIIKNCLKGIGKKTYFRDKVFIWSLDKIPSEWNLARYPSKEDIKNYSNYIDISAIRNIKQVPPQEIVAIANILDSPVNYLKFKSSIAKKISEFLGFQKLTEVSKLYIYDAIENYSNFENLKNNIDQEDEIRSEMLKADKLEGVSEQEYMDVYRAAIEDQAKELTNFTKTETDWSGNEEDDIDSIITNSLSELTDMFEEIIEEAKYLNNEINYSEPPIYWADWYNKGNALYQKKEFNEALKSYSKSFELSNNPLSLSAMGQCYFEIEEYENALDFFSKSLDMNPVQENVYFLRANTHISLNNLDEAVSDLNTALDLDDEDYKYNSLIGYVYLLQKKYPKSIKYCTRSIKNKPSKFAYLTRSYVYLELNDKDGYESDKKLSESYE